MRVGLGGIKCFSAIKYILAVRTPAGVAARWTVSWVSRTASKERYRRSLFSDLLRTYWNVGRFLYKELPRKSTESRVEFNDELALQYYRLEKSDEGSIEFGSGSGGSVSSPTETGTGNQDDEEVELSAIVEKISEELGTDFTEADQLFLDQIKEDALEDEHIQRSARVNSRENFALEFDDVITEMFIDRIDQNQDLFAKFMDNEEVQEAITHPF